MAKCKNSSTRLALYLPVNRGSARICWCDWNATCLDTGVRPGGGACLMQVQISRQNTVKGRLKTAPHYSRLSPLSQMELTVERKVPNR